MLYPMARPLLRKLYPDPESAHEVFVRMAARWGKRPWAMAMLRGVTRYRSERLKSTVAGIEFENPVGLAAGLDKTGEAAGFLENAGFGFLEIGTFTPRPQVGHPRPRIHRYDDGVLINRMGFPNGGIEAGAANIRAHDLRIPYGVSVGKQAETAIEDAVDDYTACARAAIQAGASYIAVNISSPNTMDLRTLEEHFFAKEIVRLIIKEGAERVFVKISPDIRMDILGKMIETLLSKREVRERLGFIIANTSADTSLKKIHAENREGGLSGTATLHYRSCQIVKRVYRLTAGKIPIIGVGGIMEPLQAINFLEAGASLVQVYSGYVHRGPLFVRRINVVLDRYLLRIGKSLPEIIGSKAEENKHSGKLFEKN